LERSGRAGEGVALMTVFASRFPEGKESLRCNHLQIQREAAWSRAPSDPEEALASLMSQLARLKGLQGEDFRLERALTLMTLGKVHYMFLHQPAAALPLLEEAEGLFLELQRVGTIDSRNHSAVLGD